MELVNRKWVKNLKKFNVIGGAIFVLANSLAILFFYYEFGNLPTTVLELILNDYPFDWLMRLGHIILGISLYYLGLTKLIKSKTFLLPEIFILLLSIILIAQSFYSPDLKLSEND